MRKPIVAGNWKMNGSYEGSKKLVSKIFDETKNSKVDIVLCPPAILLPTTVDITKSGNLEVGGQNCYSAASGAYTGEISPVMLKDFSCSYVIIGHSERRQEFQESNDFIAKKFMVAYNAGLNPILCVGETAQEREDDTTLEVIRRQLKVVIEQAGISAFANAVIAYEPVWAIGTGVTATSEQAQEVHSFIRSFLAESDASIAANTRIIYGGSVKPNNAKELFSEKDIDGGLIGGASLIAEDFLAICKQAEI